VRPFVPFLWAIIGCEGTPDYDRIITVSAELRSLCSYLLATIPVYAPRGVSMWPFVASSLYAALARGDAAAARVRAISYDASVQSGWGAGLQTSEDPSLRVFSGTYPPGTGSAAQVHNEGHAGALALAAVEQMVDLSDSVIIFRNDCAGALAALEFGSTTSPVLQEYAMRISRCCASHNATCLFLHVHGTSLIAEGIDEASRAGAEAERGPACGPSLRDTIRTFAFRHGWSISVDLFASSENAIVPRYYSRFPDPGAEATDALSVPSWGISPCPSCGRHHREVFFAFPPAPLLPAFIAKARADGARGIVLTPTALTGAHWGRLLRASLALDGRPYTAIRHPMPLLLHSGGFSTSELALFAVDFGPSALDSRVPDAPCAAAGLCRPRPLPSPLPADTALAAVRQDLQRSLQSPPRHAATHPPPLACSPMGH